MKAAPLHSDPPPAPPNHVAIIMDGNGRWAQAHNLPRTAGHQRGAQSVKTVIKCATEMGISYLTLFGFSSENWKRPTDEINDLMGLLSFYLRSETKNLKKNGIRLRIIGERQRLGSDIVSLIEDGERSTAVNTKLTLTVALNYGGRTEIAAAARRLAEIAAAGSLNPEDIDENLFEHHLFTSGLPDPDLLIRTSGEKRISNFLLWQLAYSEFVFVDTLWPDFSREHFLDAISEFQRRERRFGAAGG